MNLEERIQNKRNQIAKMEKNLTKYVVSDEFTAMCDRYFETHDRTELENYKKSQGIWYLPDYYSKRCDLEDAKSTLQKYLKQLEDEKAKEASLSELPEVVVEFRSNLIKRWDEYDFWKLEEIDRIYKNNDIEYKDKINQLREKFGLGWRDFSWLTKEQIHNQNVKDADALILNMINRTVSLTGKITDCKYLYLDQDNSGYTIINGLVIGESGKARIESIGAGGYNIQKYHIRVLVKEVK